MRTSRRKVIISLLRRIISWKLPSQKKKSRKLFLGHMLMEHQDLMASPSFSIKNFGR